MSAHTEERSALERLTELLREQGGLMASLVAGTAPASARGESALARTVAAGERAQGHESRSAQTAAAGASAQTHEHGPAQTAAAGPRAQGSREEYELFVEAIYEGYLLHYDTPRVLAPPEDDLGLLAGDRLYALGLARLVALGDTEAVSELADTITLSALARAADEPALAVAVWEAGARAVGWGSSEAHRHAKRLAFARAPGAIEAMRTSAAGVPTAP